MSNTIFDYDIQVKVKKLSQDAIIPKYAKPGDAARDLHSIEDFVLLPGERYLAKTGLAFELPENTEIQIRPRSGLSIKHGITIVNSPGTLDSGYRGELCVILLNTGKEPFTVKKGDRIAQMVVAEVAFSKIIEVDELGASERGTGGFGSTGNR